MTQQRACDVCKFYRQHPDGTPAVHRYGLSRQLQVPGKFRPERPHSVLFKRERHYGGIDMCDECWLKLAAPKRRGTPK